MVIYHLVPMNILVKIWNPNCGSLLYTLIGHTDIIWILAKLTIGNLASESMDNTIWNNIWAK